MMPLAGRGEGKVLELPKVPQKKLASEKASREFSPQAQLLPRTSLFSIAGRRRGEGSGAAGASARKPGGRESPLKAPFA